MFPRIALLALSIFAISCTSVAPAIVIPEIHSDSDLDALIPRLSNWGRWGDADQLATLNTITDEAIRNARKLVADGTTISLARPVQLAGNEGIRRAEYEMLEDESGTRDYLGAIWHGFTQTHMDALCHAFTPTGQMYNGVSPNEVTTTGCQKLGIGVAAARGIVGRGVLLDIGRLHGGALIPGTAIRVSDLEEALRRQKTEIHPGDLLVVRTGAGRANTRDKRAGLHPECLLWVKERQIALLMSDGDSDVAPLPGFEKWASAFHSIGIPYLGLHLVDNAELEELAAACTSRNRWEFFLVIAPWRMTGATSSPVNPIAIF